MPQASANWTAEMVRALPDDGKRYELVDGALLVTPSPAWVHQSTVAALFRRLDQFVRSRHHGYVRFSPADISLGEDEILQPDLFVVPPSHRPVRAWTDIRSLLLVVEVLSPGTARYDRLIKRRRYQRAGVPEYWIVDLDARVVERWRPVDERPEILSETIEWKPDPAADGLVVDLPVLFAEVWGETQD
ncbi:MAG TPA: Uma2 family endonuclease [Gemmatimonadales bacterium]|nr:Uma2 family endonuclease [Gemmatimonadales bacterium]